MDKKELFPLGLIALMLALAVGVGDRMPERVITHWNARGEPDGYGGRLVGVWLLPAVTLGVWGLLYVVPHIEVLEFRKNLKDFGGHYYGLRVALTAFMAALYAATVAINLGYAVDLNTFITLALAGLFYYVGHIMRYVKRNYWVGFRTPWALSSDAVWDRTHALASRMLRVSAALIAVAAVASPGKAVFATLALILGSALFITAYSYAVYRKIYRKTVEGKTG